jgi:hypothetical protein
MKTRTEVVREGELLGPIDFDFDFMAHIQYDGQPREWREARRDRIVAMLREVSAEGSTEPSGDWFVTTNGYEHPLIAVGMYDGWPFWKPMPALLYRGPLGAGEWAFYYNLDSIRRGPR